jgi:peptidoglycan/xylan/chitin deacetylase (PgdA/CDA1 family)
MLPPYTLIPVEMFEEQIEFLSRKYDVITLRQAVDALTSAKSLKNTAVITFDDGYSNNFTLALPILEKYHAPATVFVTAGYIGSEELFPLDEAYLLICQAKGRKPCNISEMSPGPLYFESNDDLHQSYKEVASFLKQLPCDQQKLHIHLLKSKLQNGRSENDTAMVDDFRILSKEELRVLAKSELIDIGAHTVNHQILSKVDARVSAWEIVHSKALLQNYTGRDIDLFSYPNGRVMDFNNDHIVTLKENGFICSVTLESRLNIRYTDPYRLGRLNVGPDFALNIAEFALRTSGCIATVKSFMGNTHV